VIVSEKTPEETVRRTMGDFLMVLGAFLVLLLLFIVPSIVTFFRQRSTGKSAGTEEASSVEKPVMPRAVENRIEAVPGAPMPGTPKPVAPLSSTPLPGTSMSRAPLGRAPLGRGPLRRAPFSRAPLCRAPMFQDLPVRGGSGNCGGCCVLPISTAQHGSAGYTMTHR
jgi:hypothetical protein